MSTKADSTKNLQLVTCYYVEKSTSYFIYARPDTTLGDLRNQIHIRAKETLTDNWGEQDIIHPDPASIMITASKWQTFPY
jgi:hypothetical protein